MIEYLKKRLKRFLYHVIREAVYDSLEEDSYNLRRELQRPASIGSANFTLDNIPLERGLDHRSRLIDRCLSEAPTQGLILEFGVYKGDSIRYIARHFGDRQVYGFDSFDGLAEPWIFDGPGAFSDVAKLPEVPRNVTLIKGWFQETLPGFLESHPGPIAFLHIDSDLYSSCRYLLEALAGRLVPGSVISFDEFYNYPGWEKGEHRAFQEWLTASGAEYEFLGFVYVRSPDWKCDGSSGEQVAIRITGMSARSPTTDGLRPKQEPERAIEPEHGSSLHGPS